MTYSVGVRPAALPYVSLSAQISQDMEPGPGVGWWTGLEPGRSILVADYTCGLTDSVVTNLTHAAMHLDRLTKLEGALDLAMTNNMRSAAVAGRFFNPTSESYDDRAVEAGGHFAGFFRAVGSVLDNVAGVVVGATGVPVNVVRTDWYQLTHLAPRVFAAAKLHPDHDALVQRVIHAVDDAVKAGAPDWIGWTLDYRNMLVHRAARLTVNIQDPRSTTGVAHPLPAHPDQTHAESFARARAITDGLVGRNTNVTLGAVMEQLTALAIAVGNTCVLTWDERRTTPNLSRQPVQQWPKMRRGTERRFTPPGEKARLGPNTVAGLNPITSERLRRARLTGSDHYQWRSWLAADDADNAGD